MRWVLGDLARGPLGDLWGGGSAAGTRGARSVSWGAAGPSLTSWTCGRRGAPRRAPSPAGRSGTGRTCGRPSADDRTAGNGCIRGRRTWACGSPSRSEPSWPLFSPTGSADGGHDGLTGEGEAELAEQLATLVVVRGGGDQRDVHAALPVDAVDVDLAEHRLLVETEGVVAVAVELLGVQATEVTDTGQGQRQQPVQELPHAVAAEGDLGADRHALAELELGDRLAGADDGGLLAGDGGEVADRAVHQLGVTGGLADAHVDHDLDQTGDLHDVRVAELRLQRRRDLLAVAGQHAGQLAGGCAHDGQRSLPVRRATRMLRPSSSLR